MRIYEDIITRVKSTKIYGSWWYYINGHLEFDIDGYLVADIDGYFKVENVFEILLVVDMRTS